MFSISKAPERRRFERFRADFSLVASVVGEQEIKSARGRCHSLSQGGIAAVFQQQLLSGELVNLELRLPNSTKSLWVDAVVRRQNSDCGMEFLSLSEEQAKAIKRYSSLQPLEKRRKEA
jgi:c-di-GMP-binding flagellar brake protein YcgR